MCVSVCVGVFMCVSVCVDDTHLYVFQKERDREMGVATIDTFNIPFYKTQQNLYLWHVKDSKYRDNYVNGGNEALESKAKGITGSNIWFWALLISKHSCLFFQCHS